ncbi:MAG TPA: leishmanolysin-related zinc metalloendopeptidase [Gemmatimonadales bacterium]|nr:leishmanolysin-related zinc metalloendopeptidase [Gemmatimonadales bacterium]
MRRGVWRFPILAALGGGLLAGCSASSKSTGPGPGVPVALAVLSGPSGSVQDRATLNPSPVVQVVDSRGDAVNDAGVAVTVTLTGGGSLSGNTGATTNSSGQASFPNLSISGTVGIRQLSFSATGLSPVSTAGFTLVAGPAQSLLPNSTQSQSGLVGQAVTVKPSVKVVDADGNGVSGVAVTFAVTAGGGSVTGANQTTGSTGAATVGSWTLGSSAGLNTVQASAAGLSGSPLNFDATGGATISNFTINIQYITQPTATQAQAFALAKARWESLITGDLGDFNINGINTGANCGNQTLSGTTNDLLILVELVPIDGVGNILGAASPCFLRSSNNLTVIGYMKFDTADLANLETNGQLNDVILHEMGHVLGFGTLWESPAPFNLLMATTASATSTTVGFTGANAVAAFVGTNHGTGSTVPVEDQFGTGTARAHWSETLFGSELMTGFIDGTIRPLSATSVQSLKDLGYVTNPAAADPFDFTNPVTLRAAGPVPAPVSLGDDVLHIPVYTLDPVTGHRALVRLPLNRQ